MIVGSLEVGRVLFRKRLFLGIGFTPLKRVSDVVLELRAAAMEVSAVSGCPAKRVHLRMLKFAEGHTSIDFGTTAGACAVGTIERREPVSMFSSPFSALVLCGGCGWTG